MIVTKPIEIDHLPNRLECPWEPDAAGKPPVERGEGREEEHVLTAADFVVDEFELYGCGD